MFQKNRILRSGATLFGGQISIQLLGLLRNFIVARLLVPEDFGVASTFAVTITALEMLSDFSVEKLIVRDVNGNDEKFQATLASLNMVRNILIALVIFFSAGWIADLFDVPEAKSAYQLIALVPIVRGFSHLDMYRSQRNMDFIPEISANIVSQIAGLVVATVLVVLTRDYTAVLWGVLAQSVALVAVTHYYAERPFRLGFQAAHAWNAFQFGWPLMVNGIVLMLSTQADRVLVGAELSMTNLAQYTIAVLLVSMPGLMMTRIASMLALPWLSEVQNDRDAFQTRYGQMGHMVGLLATVVFVPIALLGTDVIAFVFGADYNGPALLMAWLSFGMAVRFMRSRMVNAFLAVGSTKNLMLSEVVRVVGIVLAVVALWLGQGLASVGLAMCLGEIAAFALCIYRLKALPQKIMTFVGGYGFTFLVLSLSVVGAAVFADEGFVTRLIMALGLVIAGCIAQAMVSPSLSAKLVLLPDTALRFLRLRT